ncbi:MAG: PaaX family transcriptional regulator [Streptosporangiaceae bacterium]
MTQVTDHVEYGPEDAEGLDLPRIQNGSQPQHLLLTLLGDYWYSRDEHLPSAALVRLLAEFGVSNAGARAALSRLARRGLLESSKTGRRTYYGLTSRAAAVLSEGRSRILLFGTSQRQWDGNWTLVTFSVPEDERHTRHALRTRLRWLGFAPLYDGAWVSPSGSAEEVTEALADLGVNMATVMVGRVVADGPRDGSPIRAWDLDDLSRLYQRFAESLAPLRERIRTGRVGAAEGLVARTEVMDAWRGFPGLDPELPSELLPRGWPRPSAREAFVEVYDELGPLAATRVRQILGEFAPDLAALAAHHTTADLA